MTAGNKLSRIIAVFLCAVLAFGIVVVAVPRTEVQAAATVTFDAREVWSDGCNFYIRFAGLEKGKTYTVQLVAPHEIGGYSIWSPSGVTSKKKSDNVLLFTFKYNEKPLHGQIVGTNLMKGKTKKNPGVSVSFPTSTTTTKKTTKKAAKKKKAAPKKKTAAKKVAAKKKSTTKKKITATTTSVQTSQETATTTTALVVAAVNNTDATTTTVEEPAGQDPAPAVALNHNEGQKRSFVWLWFVLVLVIAGLVYLRIRALRNQGKQGKDLALDFIPGVGDLIYAMTGSTTKYAPIASDAQHGYSYNPAAGKKELKMIEEQEKLAEQKAAKTTAPTMHKRPKELSVNHAAMSAPASGSAPTPAPAGNSAAAASVAAGGIMSRDNEAKRPASPFKKIEGAAPVEKPAAPFKPATQQNSNGTIMTSAFKPSTGAHNPSDKIVSSAFKPSTGAHNPSDKIVSSALKQTQKFTPQKGPAQVTHSDNDAVKLARERAAAAREQQAMREAMKTQKTAPAASASAAKSEAKPHAPIKRPSAFSVNRAAAIASGTVESAKPANTAPSAPRQSGASLGVGASAAEASKSGPAISPARAKASSNSNQLGNLLNGRANNSGRTPVWASPSAAVSPFKQSAEALEEAKAEAAREAERQAAMEAEAPKASYADQAKTHKSAFFSRSSAVKGSQSSGDVSNAYGGIVRPTGVIGDREKKQQIQDAAMGTVLEGQKPAILDPDAHKAPTAAEPVFGFKPIDPENKYGT